VVSLADKDIDKVPELYATHFEWSRIQRRSNRPMGFVTR
jgi:hypothetical protein